MKRLVLLAGATLVMSSAAQAQDSEVKHNGEFRVRYYNDMQPSGQSNNPQNKSDIEGRLKLGLTMRKGENLQAHITLLHGTIFGRDKAAQPGLVEGTSSYSTATVDNTVLVNQAYGWWKAGDGFTIKAGRFNVELGNGEFFSADQWRLVPITHEGFQVGIDTSFAMFNAFLIKDKELIPKGSFSAGTTSAFDSDPEQHNIILSADLKNMPEALKTANLTLVQVSRSEVAGVGSANAQHAGITLGGDVAGFSYKGVYAMQMGTGSKTAALETKLAGSMFDLTVGYGLPETMGLKLWANYHSDSGDDVTTTDKNEAYVPLYYDSHRYGGRMDMFGWGNLTYFNIGAAVVPAEDMEVGLSLFGFTKTKDTGGNTFDANRRQTFITTANKSDLGMELDVYASKKYGPAFQIDAHLGAFMPGSAMKDGQTLPAVPKMDATIMQLMVMGTMMF